MITALWIVGLIAVVFWAVTAVVAQDERGSAMPVGGLIFGVAATVVTVIWVILAALHRFEYVNVFHL